MSEEGFKKLDKSVRALRDRIRELELGRRDESSALRLAVLASALCGAMLALSATTWRTIEDSDGDVVADHTLWGLAEESGLGTWTLLGVLVIAVGSVATFLADNTARAAHVVFVVFCVLTAVGIMVVSGRDDGYYNSDEVQNGPGVWLTLLAAVVVAIVHGQRFAELSRR
jgi:hypothetical protein